MNINYLRFVLLLLTSLLSFVGFSQTTPLDSTFGTNGITVSNVAAVSTAYSVAMQGTGKIVCGGTTASSALNPVTTFTLFRYNNAGALDSTFGIVGYDVSAFADASGGSQLIQVAIQPADQKIIGAGTVFTSPSTFGIARYKVNGGLDSTFGTNGVVTTLVGTIGCNLNALALQPADGKIVVAGEATLNSQYCSAIVRYNTNGTIDSTFGVNGIDTLLGFYRVVNSIAITGSGQIILAGTVKTSSGAQFGAFLMRLNSDGTTDERFGNGGIETVAQSTGGINEGDCIAVIPNDGRIYLGGISSRAAGQNSNFTLSRYSADGIPDATFGTSGTTVTNLGGSIPGGLLVLPDGTIAMCGNANFNSISVNEFTVALYDSTGALKTTFGNGGVDTLSDPSASVSNGGLSTAYAITIQPDGKLVAAGSTNITKVAVARYKSTLGGCSAFTSVSVTPPASSQTVCADDSLILTADTAGAGITSLQWMLNAVNITGATGASFAVQSAGIYSVTALNANSCAASSNPDTVVVKPLPAASTITQANNTLTASLATGYQWYLNDTAITNYTTQQITISQTGTYTVQISNSSGCSNTSAPLDVTVLGIADISAAYKVQLYPNPSNGNFAIQFSDNMPRSVSIADITGKLIATQQVSAHQDFDYTALPAGVYLMQIRNASTFKTLFVVITK